MLRRKGANRVKLRAVTMRYSRICVLTLAGLVSLPNGMALAQTRVAPPTAVESAPLAPPPGASPAQMPSAPAQTPPAPVPDSQPGPQPVQPAPPPPSPVVPQPVQPAPTLPGPAEPQPVQPPPTLPPPGQPAPPAQQRTGVPDPNATLAGKRGDTSDIDEVALVAKPVLLLSGQASWDQGFQKLSESFNLLRAEAQKAGLPVAGRPLSLFVETTDDGFRFDAMLPVAAPAGDRFRPLAAG